MARQTIQRNETNLVQITRLRDESPDPDERYPQTATVTATVFDENNAPVGGATDLVCSPVTGTGGSRRIYQAVLSHTVSLPEDTYTLVATATLAGGAVGVERITLSVTD